MGGGDPAYPLYSNFKELQRIQPQIIKPFEDFIGLSRAINKPRSSPIKCYQVFTVKNKPLKSVIFTYQHLSELYRTYQN